MIVSDIGAVISLMTKNKLNAAESVFLVFGKAKTSHHHLRYFFSNDWG